MVIRLARPGSFRRALRYNEKKVGNHQAVCIYAGNFILEAHGLTLHDKEHRFDRLDRLRPDATGKAIHVSINFHPADNPDREKFIRVATAYIRELGFAAQPWLLYQHTDTRHPHLHLVASSVTSEGRILPTYIEFNRLVEIRHRLEIDHGLVQAHRRVRDPHIATSLTQHTSLTQPAVQTLPRHTSLAQPAAQTLPQPASQTPPLKPVYGQALTRDAITSTLAQVLPSYNYSNLTELNALLREYGIWADAGKPGGHLAAIRGLSYQMLDSEGKAIGKRVGAGAIDFNPGLDYLEARFRLNAQRDPADLRPLATRVQLAGLRAPDDWQQFVTELRTTGVEPVPFMNPQGQIYNIVFIDHPRKLAVAAHRLVEPATLKHLHLRPPVAIDHQRALVRDMNRARQHQLRHPADEHTLSLHRRKEKQHTLSH